MYHDIIEDMETATLKNLFWDIDEKSLNNLSEKSIITRALSSGTLLDMKAIFSLYGKEKVRETLHSLKKGALSEKRHIYFELILS